MFRFMAALGRVRGWFHPELWRWKLITRHVGDPYMWRLMLWRIAGRVFFHRFMSADDECFHDHPWPFVTFIVTGGYWEWLPLADVRTHEQPRAAESPRIVLPDGRLAVRIWRRPGTVLYRPSRFLHRIEPGPRPCRTLVLTWTKQREWGFLTPFGWKHWKAYDYAQHCPA